MGHHKDSKHHNDYYRKHHEHDHHHKKEYHSSEHSHGSKNGCMGCLTQILVFTMFVVLISLIIL